MSGFTLLLQQMESSQNISTDCIVGDHVYLFLTVVVLKWDVLELDNFIKVRSLRIITVNF